MGRVDLVGVGFVGVGCVGVEGVSSQLDWPGVDFRKPYDPSELNLGWKTHPKLIYLAVWAWYM